MSVCGTVKSGRMPLPSGTWAIPRRTIYSGRRPVIAVPPSAILPEAALAMPLMARSRVDLPDPLAPRMATSWPASTFMETSCNASTEPYRTLRSVTSSFGSLARIGCDGPRVAQHVGAPLARFPLAPQYARQNQHFAQQPVVQRAVTGDEKVLARRQVENQLGMLEHPPDALARHVGRVQRREDRLAQAHAARGRTGDAGDAVEQRALAGAIGPDQPDDGSGLEGKADVLQRMDAAEIHRHVLDGKTRHLSASIRVVAPCPTSPAA